MKINKLFIKNINSLAGEHEVDFDEINERSDGVYLIVGATGSGKTTILDSITLGLFGAVKRLGDIAAGNIEKTGSIITHGARDARVDVVFTTKGARYTARWQIRHKVRSAGWEGAQMSLYDANDLLLESGLSQTKKKIVELIGMTFDQFNKAILLAQGDFASFLKSKFSDKADILEKITGTENYSKIGKAVYDKNNELKLKTEEITLLLNNLSVRTEEEVADLKISIQDLTQNITLYQKRSDELSQLINDRNNYTKEKNLLSQIEEKLTSERRDLKEIETAHGDTIRQYDIAINIKPQYENHALLLKEAPALQERQKFYENESAKLAGQRSDIFSSVNGLFEFEENEASFVSNVGKFKDEIINIEHKLSAIKLNKKGKSSALINELNRLKDNSLIQLFESEKYAELSIQTKLKTAEIRNQLISLKGDNSMDEVSEEALDALHTQLRTAESLQHLTQRFVEIISQLKTKTEQLNNSGLELNSLVESLNKKNVDLKSFEKTFRDKETILRQQEKIRSLEHHRMQLSAGEDCPLCGAADGPLRHKGAAESDEYEIQFKEAKRLVDQIKTEIIREETKHKSVADLIGKLNVEIVEINSQKDKFSTEIISGKNQLSITESLNDKQILIDKIQSIQHLISSVKRIIKLNETLPNLEQAIIYILELEELLNNENVEHDLLRAKFPLDIPIQSWAEKLISDFDNYQQRSHENQIDLNGVKTLIARNEEQILTLSSEIESFVSQHKLGSIITIENLFAGQTQILVHKSSVEKLRQLIFTNESLFHSTLERVRELELKVDESIDPQNYQDEKAEINQKISADNQELGGIKAQLELHSSNVAKGKLLQEQLETLERIWNPVRILNTLIGSATGSEFKKIAQKITLSHLAVLANKHLSLMNDRYQFRFDTRELWSKDDADLMIHDAFDPEGLRSCATLSGGETFIASLALALGLSDFASENNKIESLFIDEGFGTLDPDTLEMAIGALEKIQSSGNKTVCLITHVEAMKERIPYHLVVEKGRKGLSTIRHEIN